MREEIRLAKPALLYGDSVTLYSATAMMLASAEEIAALDDDGLIEFVRLLGDAIGPAAEQVAAQYEWLRDKRRRTREELQAFVHVKRMLRQAAGELQRAVEPMLEQAGADELVPAIEAGLLRIDPLLTESTDDMDALFDAYLNKLRGLLTDQAAYPLFDEQAGGLVRAGIEEGMFEIGATSVRRGKHAALASDFIARVPAFPEASIAEILDVRDELRRPLTRFRAAVSSFSRQVQSAAHDRDFAAEVADIYLAEVEPVLEEIREAVASNTYLRNLGRQATSSVKEMLTTGGLLGIGLMGLADAPAVASVVVGATAAGAHAATAAAVERRQQEATERDRLFFLYRTEQALAG